MCGLMLASPLAVEKSEATLTSTAPHVCCRRRVVTWRSRRSAEPASRPCPRRARRRLAWRRHIAHRRRL